MNPTPKDYWRALILYGRQQSTYKIALGDCLLNYASSNYDQISLDDLAEDFYDLYYERLKNGKPQLGTSGRKTVVEREIESVKFTDRPKEKALENIKKSSLSNMVLQRFNVLNNNPIPEPFYTISESDNSLLLNNNLLSIFDDDIEDTEYLSMELNSRWDLLEHSFESINNIGSLDVDEYIEHIVKKEERKNLTNLIPVLNGYQRNKCFYCGEDLYDMAVDHVIPYQATMHNEIWNLVLAHDFCNEQKSDNLPPKRYINDLIKRNEYFIKSDHPIKNTLIRQLGDTDQKRQKRIYDEYNYAINKIGRVWGGKLNYDFKNDSFYKTWVRIFGRETQ